MTQSRPSNRKVSDVTNESCAQRKCTCHKSRQSNKHTPQLRWPKAVTGKRYPPRRREILLQYSFGMSWHGASSPSGRWPRRGRWRCDSSRDLYRAMPVRIDGPPTGKAIFRNRLQIAQFCGPRPVLLRRWLARRHRDDRQRRLIGVCYLHQDAS
jgi:hypothetical protein